MLQPESVEIRRYSKIPLYHLSSSPTKLLKQFDSRNFVQIDAELMTKIRNLPARKRKGGPLNNSIKTMALGKNNADLGLKSIYVSRRPSNNTMRRKITASSEHCGADAQQTFMEMESERPSPNMPMNNARVAECNLPNNGIAKKLAKSSAVKLPKTTASRRVRYGWFAENKSDEFKIKNSTNSNHKLRDPDEWVCFNERKAWARDHMLCVGGNLCKWL